MTGYEDLDEYGSTGAMWQATVRAGGRGFWWRDGLRIALATGLGGAVGLDLGGR
jgi:hypothetical protein